MAAARAVAIETARIALAPSLALFSVPSRGPPVVAILQDDLGLHGGIAPRVEDFMSANFHYPGHCPPPFRSAADERRPAASSLVGRPGQALGSRRRPGERGR